MADEPVRRWEFEQIMKGVDRRIESLETDFDNHLKAEKDGRRWTWQQVWAAIGAAAVLGGLFLEVRAK